MVPADRPDRVAGRVAVAGDATRPGDISELVAADDRPTFGLAVPLGEDTGGDSGVGGDPAVVFAVVGVDQSTLAGVEPLAVVSRQASVAAALELFVPPEFGDGQGPAVQLVDAFLHSGEVDLIRWVRQVAGVPGESPVHRLRRNHANLPRGIDDVGPDEELLAFRVDHAVGWSATDALGADRLSQRRVDFIELVG